MIRLRTLDNTYFLLNPDYLILAETAGRDLTKLTIDIPKKDGTLTEVVVQISLDSLNNQI